MNPGASFLKSPRAIIHLKSWRFLSDAIKLAQQEEQAYEWLFNIILLRMTVGLYLRILATNAKCWTM